MLIKRAGVWIEVFNLRGFFSVCIYLVTCLIELPAVFMSILIH